MTVTVNDVSYDHGSTRIELSLPDGETTGLTVAFSDFTYDQGVSRSKQIGAERVANQATEGQYDANAGITFYQNLYDAVLAWFAANDLPLATTEIQLSVQYWSKEEAAHEDVIPRTLWQKSSHSSSEGTDATKVPVELFVLGTIFHDGVDVYNTKLA